MVQEYLRKAHETSLLTEREKHLIGLAVTMTRGCQVCTCKRPTSSLSSTAGGLRPSNELPNDSPRAPNTRPANPIGPRFHLALNHYQPSTAKGCLMLSVRTTRLAGKWLSAGWL